SIRMDKDDMETPVLAILGRGRIYAARQLEVGW
ncbi:MAG: hypothetical protein ACI82F_001038, partial [Planctomycetota bacterium]